MVYGIYNIYNIYNYNILVRGPTLSSKGRFRVYTLEALAEKS